MSDKMDDLFNFDNHDPKNMLEEAKGKSFSRIVLISIAMSVYIFGLIYLMKVQITPFLLTNKINEVSSYYDIFGANKFVGMWDEDYRFIGSTAKAPIYKIIDDKPVKLGDIVAPGDLNFDEFSLNSNWPEHDTRDIFTYEGIRKLQFYHPYVTYENYKNDLSLVNDIPRYKNLEYGLSFDQAYTLEEVQKMLPKDVKLQWVWVDTYNENEVESLKSYKTEAGKIPSQVINEDNAAGFHLYDKVGEPIKNPKKSFIENLELAVESKGKYKDEITSVYNYLKEDQKEIQSNNILIIGAVVTGDKEDMKKLIDQKYIKASVLGAAVDKY